MTRERILMGIMKQLSGGDRRSIGKVDKVVSQILKDTSLFDELFNGLYHANDVVRMRSADAIEKISRTNPELLKPYKTKIINDISKSLQQELRWHLAQIFPRLKLTDKQKQQVVSTLLSYFKDDNSIIVKTFSLQALFDLSINDDPLNKTVLLLAKQACKTGKPALQSRAKKLLSKLDQMSEKISINKQNQFKNSDVENKFDSYPKKFRKKLMFLRQLIFETAANTDGAGELEETLKWGEPSYVTSQTKSGSTVRIDWKKSYPHQYAMYFNCKTTLVDTFKEIYGNLFTYGGNRSIIFQENDEIPVDELSDCIAMAFTYNLHKKRRRNEKRMSENRVGL